MRLCLVMQSKELQIIKDDILVLVNSSKYCIILPFAACRYRPGLPECQ